MKDVVRCPNGHEGRVITEGYDGYSFVCPCGAWVYSRKWWESVLAFFGLRK